MARAEVIMKRFAALGLLALAACSSNVTIGGAPDAGQTNAPITDPPETHKGNIDKVDLLFVVDNSISMADKQIALSKRIPELMRYLTQIGVSPITGGAPKIVDLHVGTITTSLGSQGTSACDPSLTNAHNDDRAHLLPRKDDPAPATGYVWKGGATEPTPVASPKVAAGAPIRWVLDPAADPSAQFKGETALPDLEAAATCTVLSAKDDGCGYEMPLEAMYRFLVDPAPPKTLATTCSFGPSGDACGTNDIVASGVDDELLAQRAAFLRPDSLLAIVLITDENDASLRAEGKSWIPWAYGKGQMRRGYAACDGVPDDIGSGNVDQTEIFSTYGCQSCFKPGASDGRCDVPWATDPRNADVDGRNLRAFHQLQRYGYDFLYPLSRYVDGLTKKTVIARDGTTAPNPIFAGGRARDMVLLAGIVGAPPKLVNDATGYPRALGEDDWKKLVSPTLSERDPHMIESIGPRAGIPKYAGDPSIDPTNGGDRDVATGDDLQYACLGAPSSESAEHIPDCSDPGAAAGNPACHDGVRAKAYPALRPLRVIHGVGSSGYVASICDETYRGAIAGIAKKIGEGCAGK
jgi:hypothetical protein